jgi:hypothetical protein
MKKRNESHVDMKEMCQHFGDIKVLILIIDKSSLCVKKPGIICKKEGFYTVRDFC